MVSEGAGLWWCVGGILNITSHEYGLEERRKQDTQFTYKGGRIHVTIVAVGTQKNALLVFCALSHKLHDFRKTFIEVKICVFICYTTFV